MNKVMIIGRLAAEPDIRTTKAGEYIAHYRVAVDRYSDGAYFIPCVAFKKNAEFVQKYLHKGMRIAIEGHLQTDSFEKPDGTKAFRMEVAIDRHEFCESRAAGSNHTNDDFEPVASPAEDLPF